MDCDSVDLRRSGASRGRAACCERLVERMRAIGLEARVLETDGNPLAFGEWLSAQARRRS